MLGGDENHLWNAKLGILSLSFGDYWMTIIINYKCMLNVSEAHATFDYILSFIEDRLIHKISLENVELSRASSGHPYYEM